jgi:hypothetical protein
LVYRNGRPRLQHSIRRGGRVTTEYVASGEVALLGSRLEDLQRERSDLERLAARLERESIANEEQPLIDVCHWVEDLARAALYAAGYHRPKREWRRRRGRHQQR